MAYGLWPGPGGVYPLCFWFFYTWLPRAFDFPPSLESEASETYRFLGENGRKGPKKAEKSHKSEKSTTFRQIRRLTTDKTTHFKEKSLFFALPPGPALEK
jgi:hypothetical protein